MNNDVVSRIKELMSYYSINSLSLSKKLGYNSSEKISRLFRERGAKPSYDIIYDISNTFEINTDWLITGRGFMLHEDGKINPILPPEAENRKSAENRKNHVHPNVHPNVHLNVHLNPISPLESGKTTSTNLEKEKNTPSIFLPDCGKTTGTNIVELPVPVGDDSATVSIPVVEISVAAGSGFYNPDYLSEIDCIRMPRSMIKGGQPHICVRIKGESMVPTLQDGGYLVIRLLDRCEWRDVRDGHVYVVSSAEGRAFVKRLKNRFKEFGFIVCMSDNPDPMGYPNFNLQENEINTIWHAEWYISAKMPNIHATYYKKVDEMEDAIEEMRSMFTNELQQMKREIRTLSK